MKTASEAWASVLDPALFNGNGGYWEPIEFQYRVTINVKDRREEVGSVTWFNFYEFGLASQCYREFRLAFFVGNDIESFAICLNHFDSKEWEKPIYSDGVNEMG